MDPAEIDAIVQRLVADPHDEEALAYAHQEGEQDPKSYAFLLEKVGNETPDPSYASHWLAEAANVWSTTLGDAHRAARVLMMAIDKDPTQAVAAERLATLYREKGDFRGLVALLERRSKALAPLIAQSPELRGELAGMHEELGRLWSEAPLSQPKKAIESYRRAIELDPQSAYAIFQARELLKQAGQFDEALALYQAELQIEPDPTRRLMLMRDEAGTRRQAGDLTGSSRVLAAARQMDEEDPGLAQEYASSVIDRAQAGEPIPPKERASASELLISLAEQYDGDHGLAYASGALDLQPGSDRALQLFAYYAEQLGRSAETRPRYAAYVQANPNGAMAAEARQGAGSAYPPPVQAPARGGSASAPPTQHAHHSQAPAAMTLPGEPPSSQEHSDSFLPPQSSSEASFRRAQPNNQGPLTPDKLQGILDAAQMLAGKGKKPEAFIKYKEVLDADPAHPEALAWIEDYLRSKRDYAQLRDVLLASVRLQASQNEAMETRKERLREVAGLCEGNLRDIDGAISAWKQLLAIDRTDESARTALTRLLEKQQRWDDLANLLEQEATAESEIDTKIALEKKLALLQEQKRKDLGAAAEAWARIARLTPDDERPTQTASKLFEKAGLLDMAATIIADNAPQVDDVSARGALLDRLGELRELLNDTLGAGEAYADAAELVKSPKLWEAAERCFVTLDNWERAAHAAGQRGLLASDTKGQAGHYARAADQLMKGGDEDAAIGRLEQATDLDPLADDYASALQDRYQSRGDFPKLAEFLGKRGDRVTDRGKRVAIRRQTANLYATQLQDKELARELWLKVLEDGDDREALEKLVDYAVEREDHNEAVTLLRRLQANTVDKAEKARVALREAELLAEGIGDVDTAINRYEAIVRELDPTCRPALQAIADLQEARDNPSAAADALERELKLIADPQERGQIAVRLARLYEQLGDSPSAIRALDIVRKGDPEDFDALSRLCELCEKTEQWDRVATLLAERIEVEGDEEEASVMTRKLAQFLSSKLDRGDEALAVLTDFADQGNAACRVDYLALGDQLGWKGIVAQKLVEWWFEAKHGPERTTALRGAFDRFESVGREQDAARVAMEIVRSKGADRELAERLENLASKTNDHDALSVAHDLLSRDATAADRAHELVRQAESRVKAGMPRNEAIQHGEAGLTSVAPGDAEPLLERLSQLAAKPNDVIDLYERQVSRSKAPADRVRALGRAAQIASTRGQLDRARGFFELAITGTPSDETLAAVEAAAREGDAAAGGEKLRRALCQAMAAGGTGARDGGRTRGSLLRRAAAMAHKDLGDVDQAFAWLGDALVAHVDTLTLDALEGLGIEIEDPRRAEESLTHALTDVFDGPLVRQLLARRAKIRREQIGDKPGAAADLKKLHDLSPTDQAVMADLSGLLTELGDYRGMVQLYEDQILRGKDMNARAELARKVARMWEEQLADPREAADAWRRVLRMKPGDTEATQGLERSKSNMLKKPDPNAEDAYAPPVMGPSSQPPSTLSPSSYSQPPSGYSQPPPLPSQPPPLPSQPTGTVPPTRASRPSPGAPFAAETTEMAHAPAHEPLTARAFPDLDVDLDPDVLAHGAHDAGDAPTASTRPHQLDELGAPTVKPGSLETIALSSTGRAQRPGDVAFRSSADEATANVVGGASAFAPSTLREESPSEPSDGELIANQLPGPGGHDAFEPHSAGAHTLADARSAHTTMHEEDMHEEAMHEDDEENLGATGEMPVPSDLGGHGSDPLDATHAHPRPRRYDSDHTQTSGPVHSSDADSSDMTEIGSSPALLVEDEEVVIADDDSDIEILDDDEDEDERDVPANGRTRTPGR